MLTHQLSSEMKPFLFFSLTNILYLCCMKANAYGHNRSSNLDSIQLFDSKASLHFHDASDTIPLDICIVKAVAIALLTISIAIRRLKELMENCVRVKPGVFITNFPSTYTFAVSSVTIATSI